MKNYLVLLALLFTTLLTAISVAQPDGWDKESDYTKLYNAKTTATLQGKIVSVNRNYRLSADMSPGVVAVVDTGDSLVNVHIGPQWFTNFYRSEWNLETGDEVEVTGSLITYDGSESMILRSGKKGDLQMTIRGPQGAPIWDPEARPEVTIF